MKRLLVIALALIVVMGMSTSVFAYTPLDDDGDYSRQQEDSMNVIYCNMGMLRIQDEGTSVNVNQEGTKVDVVAKTTSSKTWGKITKLAFIEENANDAEKDAAAADIVFEDANLYEDQAVSRVLRFSIPVQDIGKRIPVCRYASGKWTPFSEPAYYTVLHTKGLYDQLKTAYSAATDATVKANLETALKNADYNLTNNVGMFSPESAAVVKEGKDFILKLTMGSTSMTKVFVGFADEATDEKALNIDVSDGSKGYVDIPVAEFDVPVVLAFKGKKGWNNRTVVVSAKDRTVVFLNTFENAAVEAIPDQVFTGSTIEPDVSVTFKSGSTTTTLEKDKDYLVTYGDNTNAGTGTVTVTGMGIYAGTKTAEFAIDPADMKDAAFGAFAAKTYTGKALTPAPKVTFNGAALKKGTDYTVAYKNNTNAGKATVTVTGKGNFTGTKTATFVINPAAQKLKVSAASKTVKAKALKKKAQSTTKVAVSGAKGKTTYVKVAKGSAKNLTINKTTGKITVAKKTKKGTYKIKVKVSAAKTKNFKAATATKTIKVVVK